MKVLFRLLSAVGLIALVAGASVVFIFPGLSGGPPGATVYASLLSKPAGTQTTDFSIQNLSTTSDATVQIVFYNPDIVGTITDTILKGQSCYYNQGAQSVGCLKVSNPLASLTSFGGSAVVSSNQPIAIVANQARNDVGPSDPAYFADGYVGVQEADTATTVYAPIIMGKLGSWNTRMAVQNVGDSEATAYVTYKEKTGATRGTDQVIIKAKASKVIDQFDNGSLSNFIGSAIITSTNKLAVEVDEYAPGMMVSYTGIPESKASTTLLMPGFLNAWGDWATDFTIVNTSASAAQVTVSFSNGQYFTDTINAKAFQYYNPPNLLGVPSGFTLAAKFLGSATITSTMPIVASYNIANTFGTSARRNFALGYNAIASSDAGTQIALPSLANHGWNNNWDTTFSVSATSYPAILSISYSGFGLSSAKVVPVTITEPKTFNQTSDHGLPVGYGVGTITSDKPIVVIADMNLTGAVGDTAAGYPGTKVQ